MHSNTKATLELIKPEKDVLQYKYIKKSKNQTETIFLEVIFKFSTNTYNRSHKFIEIIISYRFILMTIRFCHHRQS